jgi:hypothetical protein
LIERVWKFLKKKVCRTFYSRFSEFQEAIRSFFAQIGSYKDELESLLTMNFPIVQPFFKKA